MAFTAACLLPDGGALASDFRVVGDGRNAILSANGQVVVGHAYSGAPGVYQVFRWSPSQGFAWIPLAVQPEDPSWLGCIATAVSADGSKIFMSCQFDLHHVITWPVEDVAPYMYENGAFTGLERPNDQSYIAAVTPDGSIAAGLDVEEHAVAADFEFRTYRWIGGVADHFDALPAGNCGTNDDDDSFAVGISDDGRTIVGNSGETWDYSRAIIWIDGVESRLDPFGPECGVGCFDGAWGYSAAYALNSCGPVRALSGDGRFAVGNHLAQPLYWTVQTRIATLLPGLVSSNSGFALCVSRDGSLIGGSCYVGPGQFTGVLWDRASGVVRPVEDVLAEAGLGASIGGWNFVAVTGISADGMQIVGSGLNPSGQFQYWWADLRNPPTNDDCVAARTLNPNHTPTWIRTDTFIEHGTVHDAGADGYSDCAAGGDVNVWYSYRAPVAGFLSLDLCGTANLPGAYIAVHGGCPAGLANQILCSNACPEIAGCTMPCVPFPMLQLNANQTYYIAVGGAVNHDFSLAHRFLPLNDACSAALDVGHNPSITPGSTGGMTIDAAPSCQGFADTAPGVWYKVIGTGTTMTADTCLSATFDSKLSVYCGGCGVLTCVAANDDACGPNGQRSSVSWCSAPGAIYQILVHGYQLQSGNFTLRITDDGVPCGLTVNCLPAHDGCAQAQLIESGTTTGDNTGATTGTPSASCAASSKDVWYRYVAKCDAALWVDTCQLGVGSIVDTVVSLYDGCTGSELVCNDDYNVPPTNCQNRSVAIASVTQGQEALIRVAGFGSSGSHVGTFPLRVTEVPAPLTVTGGTVPNGALGQSYQYQVVIGGACGNRFASATGLPPGLSINPWTGLISGTPQSAGNFTIHVDVCTADVSDPECAAADLALLIISTNDACANAIPIGEGLHYFSNAGATTDGPAEPSCPPGEAQVPADVWYRYTSTCQGQATVDLCDSDYDTKVAVYYGGCPLVSSAIACDDDACNYGSRVAFPITAGAVYLIRVGGYGGAQGQGRMLISCFNDCNSNGQSDSLELASGSAPDLNFNGVPDGCDHLRGDMNCDGRIDNFDIDPFVLAIVTPAQWQAAYPSCDPLNGDVNGNGRFDNFDIDPFVSCLLALPPAGHACGE